MTRLADDALAAIRARADAATPGPWGVLIHDDCTEINAPGRDRVAVFPYRHNPRDEADAAFVCDARTDVPALLAHIAALEDDRDEAVKEAERLCGMADAVAEQRDTLAAKLAERDEQLRHMAEQAGPNSCADYARRYNEAIAKLAEVEHERDEARDRYQRLTGDWSRLNESYDRLHKERDAALAERDRLLKLFDDAGQGEHNVLALVDHYQKASLDADAEQRRLAAEVAKFERLWNEDHERLAVAMRQLREALAGRPSPVSASDLERLYDEYRADVAANPGTKNGLDAYRAAPQPPAVEPGRHADDCSSNQDGTCDCHLNPIASAIRALPNEEPPSGMIERVIARSLPRLAEAERQAEVRRCEVAVVEAVLAEGAAADRYADAHNQFTGPKFGSSARAESEFRLTELLATKIAAGDALRSAIRDLRAAREKAGGE